MDRACGTYGRQERCLDDFGGERLLGRPGRRWEDNIKVGLQEF